jgi:hypothetical protein
MKILQSTIVAFVGLTYAGFAQAATGPVASEVFPSMHDQRPIAKSLDAGTSGRTVRNPNECAPDQAEPVWSATSALLGYACRNNANGA